MVTAIQIKNSANAHLGIAKYSSGHKKIIDTYNSVKPLPVGYAVKYDDDWCDAFVTYIGIINKATDLIGRECGVQRHKAIFQKMGIWLGKIRPQVGDVIIFDWQANGWADHIGFVTGVNGNTITTTEGNTNNRVGQNKFAWNDWRIVGYARPKYGKASPVKPQVVTEVVVQQVLAGAFGNGQARVDNLKALGYNPDEVQKAVNKAMKNELTPITTDAYLSYNGNSLSKDMINEILKYAKEYDFNPVFLIMMLHFEGLWGGSEVAKLNNNLAGITWSATYKGHPDVPKAKGSARPANEGGHYVKYNSIADFLKDWTYLLRPNHFYKVTGNKSFNDSIKGLFKVGGAKYDYAASGYDHYLAGMNGRKNAIEKQNAGKLEVIRKAFNEDKNISGEEIIKAPESPKGENKSVDTLAKEVIKGLWGVGEDRVTRLTEAEYDYNEVQAYVNRISAPVSLKQLDDIAKDVINGKYGNGKDRTEKLKQEGYDVEKVQSRVNELLKQDLTEVAKDVIRGQYSVGEARVRNLRAVGYNPDDVQAKVNELLG